jgi:hypothetical protein
MKILKSEYDFGYKKQTISLSDILLPNKNSVIVEASRWAIFEKQLQVAKSIETVGLKNPIIVLKCGNKYEFCGCGSRIQFAVFNGYTHIDAIILNNSTEVRSLMDEQSKTTHMYIDEKCFHHILEGEE